MIEAYAARWAGVAMLALLAVGCEEPVAPPSDPGAAVRMDQRRLRLVLLGFDDNRAAPGLEDDLVEFARAPWSPEIHRISISDTDRAAAPLVAYRDDGPTQLRAPEPADPMNGVWLGEVLADLADRFPAEHEILIVSGHGRDWQGLGLRDGRPEAMLTAAGLADALPPASRLLVLDASWSARVELLLPFATRAGAPVVVAATGELSGEGIDHSILPPVTGSAYGPATIADFYADRFASGAQVVPAATIAGLPQLCASLSAALASASASATDSGPLRAALLGAGIAPTLPGSGSVTLADAGNALGHPVGGATAELLLYLTELDYLGAPLGLHPDYGTTGLAPAVLASGWPDALNEFWSLP